MKLDRNTVQNCYQMIDVRLVDSDGTPTPSSTPESSDAEEEDDDADSGQGMTEIRYVPDDKSKLEEMFTVRISIFGVGLSLYKAARILGIG